MNSSQLRPAQAVKFINVWLNRNNYSDLFPNDLGMLLSENRRVGRASNIGKYGRIPFSQDSRGRVYYKLDDLEYLCNEQIKPICIERARIRKEKADKAAENARLPYAD